MSKAGQGGPQASIPQENISQENILEGNVSQKNVPQENISQENISQVSIPQRRLFRRVRLRDWQRLRCHVQRHSQPLYAQTYRRKEWAVLVLLECRRGGVSLGHDIRQAVLRPLLLLRLYGRLRSINNSDALNIYLMRESDSGWNAGIFWNLYARINRGL
jgi:hypothetical protein